jgi:signal transduction histidine kinase
MNAQRTLLLLAALLAALFAPGAALPAHTNHTDLSNFSVADLKTEIETVQSRLDQLPLRLIRETGGTLGFRGQQKKNKTSNAWVEIDLEKTLTFDTVIVVPAVIINESKECTNYAFPTRFQLHIYASPEDQIGQLLFDSTVTPLTPPPNQTPGIIHCPSTSARRIRFTALELFELPEFPQSVFALSEILVFNGNQNLALGKPVSSPNSTRHIPIWHKDYLTDGYLPYAQPQSREVAPESYCRMQIPPGRRTNASITLDLGREHLLNEVRLYPVHIGNNFAISHKTALGFPEQFSIEVSSDADFTSPTVIFNTGSTDYPTPGHRLACFSAKNTVGRFVRITARQLQPHPQFKGSILALAELEVVAEGEVVSRGAKVTLSHPEETRDHPPSMLVDGISSRNIILPLRPWLTDLSERNRMEIWLAALQTELQGRYLRQAQIIHLMAWGIAIIILIALIVYFQQRLIRQHQIYRLRENLAADLHDEVGGNFSGIALLCDELAHEHDMPEAHIPQLIAVSDISRNSANNARALVRFLESRNITGELLGQMKATADLLLPKQLCRFEITGEKNISKLSPKDKWHLLLFFKESLTNIAKHAAATDVNIRLQLTPQRLTLSITDDGWGLGNRPPAHLAMRAQKLKAKLTLSIPPGGGTAITLEKKL